jgi:hypothetical protein
MKRTLSVLALIAVHGIPSAHPLPSRSSTPRGEETRFISSQMLSLRGNDGYQQDPGGTVAEPEQLAEAILILERLAVGGAKRRGRPPVWMVKIKDEVIISGGAIIDHEAPRERCFVAVEK